MLRQHAFLKQSLAAFFVGVLLLAAPMMAVAADTTDTGGDYGGGSDTPTGTGGVVTGTGGVVTGTGGSPTSGSGVTSFTFENPLNVSSFCGLVQKLLKAGLQLGVPVALLFLVYSGFLFVKARGNPTGLQKAKANFAYVLLGLAIYFGAWLLGQVVANTINSVSSGTISTSCK